MAYAVERALVFFSYITCLGRSLLLLEGVLELVEPAWLFGCLEFLASCDDSTSETHTRARTPCVPKS